ncbi:MAG: peptidoglycan-binding protein [Pseudomonadota bacterium]
MEMTKFRGERNAKWHQPTALSGGKVEELQAGLKELGYLPHGEIDGICGYRTQASIRLFQEYTRIVLGNPTIGASDGIAGSKTFSAIEAALANGDRCRWTAPRREKGRPWPELLKRAREIVAAQYAAVAPELLEGSSDTLPPDKWVFDDAPVHILALRRTSWAASLDNEGRRLNNDVFVVTSQDQDLCFFGSTDPDPPRSRHQLGVPYLCKGQHSYRFGFHRLWDRGAKCYRALRPASSGVRVVRDRDGERTLLNADRLDASPNPTINLHWSGRGTTNWSAGCQVVAGAVYLNDEREPVDCWDSAATSYNGLGGGRGRGAYDVLMSWVTVCSPNITRFGRVPLTLLEERDLAAIDPELCEAAVDAFATAARTVASHDRSLQNLIADRAPHLLA